MFNFGNDNFPSLSLDEKHQFTLRKHPCGRVKSEDASSFLSKSFLLVFLEENLNYFIFCRFCSLPQAEENQNSIHPDTTSSFGKRV